MLESCDGPRRAGHRRPTRSVIEFGTTIEDEVRTEANWSEGGGNCVRQRGRKGVTISPVNRKPRLILEQMAESAGCEK